MARTKRPNPGVAATKGLPFIMVLSDFNYRRFCRKALSSSFTAGYPSLQLKLHVNVVQIKSLIVYYKGNTTLKYHTSLI